MLELWKLLKRTTVYGRYDTYILIETGTFEQRLKLTLDLLRPIINGIYIKL